MSFPHRRQAVPRMALTVFAVVLAYWLAAVHIASAEQIYNGAQGHTSNTYMSTSGSGPTYYQATASSNAYYSDDSNYTVSRGYNNSTASGWHYVAGQTCGFTSGVSSSCSTAPVVAGSSQDNASQRRVSTRHSYWWPSDASEYYTSARYQAGINNSDGYYSSYNCVYYAVC